MYCTCIDNNVTNTCDPSLCVLPTFITYDIIHYNCVAIAAVIDYMFKFVFCTCIV